MIKGKLHMFFETGMEGCEWAVIYENPDKYKRKFFNYFYVLQEGDKLKVLEREKVIWQGRIKKDKQTNLSARTSYPYPRQVVDDYIVHWLQKDVNPSFWARLFLDEKECELEIKVKNTKKSS